MPQFADISSDNLATHHALPLSSIGDLTAIVDELASALEASCAFDGETEIKLADLQSRMLKSRSLFERDCLTLMISEADMRVGQADKFLKARQDPSFARVLQVKDLNPEQAANQTKLRKTIQMIDARLEELSTGVSGLRKRVDRRDSGRQTAKYVQPFMVIY